MGTRPPGAGRIAAMVVFTLSCFGLLIFLWLSFGGAVPLKPKGYRIDVAFPEAPTLAEQADVRIAGVSVGKVVAKELDKKSSRTLATIELEREFAPIRQDARAILRQKTLLGETYVELTAGSKDEPVLEENGRLDNGQVAPTVELDEVLRIFPEESREDFRRWQANASRVIEGRDRDLNAALGNLGPFARDGSTLLQILDRRRGALKSLVSETGTVFEAFTEDENALRAFLADSSQWFQATASRREQLAEAFQIFPTFLDETKATFERVETFAADTDPLVRDLRPVARDLQPTLRDLRRLSPDLRNFFGDLPELIAASRNLPELDAVLDALGPVFDATNPWLAQVNPLLQFLEIYNGKVSDFLNIGPSALAGKRATINPNSNGHVLPQLIVLGSQSVVTPERTQDNRGNSYFSPDALADSPAYGNERDQNIFPNWDCRHIGGPKQADDTPGCFIDDPPNFQGRETKYPQVREDMPEAPTR